MIAITEMKFKTIVPCIEESTCPLCGDDDLMLVATTMKLDIRDRGPVIIPNYLYLTCENPSCGFEFVTPTLKRHNEATIFDEN